MPTNFNVFTVFEIIGTSNMFVSNLSHAML